LPNAGAIRRQPLLAVGPILVWSPRRGQPLLAVGPILVWSPRRGQPLLAVGPILVWSPRRGQPLLAVGPLWYGVPGGGESLGDETANRGITRQTGAPVRGWLGGQDSNLDTQIQSLMAYR